ncbi:MAG TPA: NAD(P)-binding domain-containing protein [Steroidobacteraceae bacterium]|nr:NAD(P)-binding domain-containing protein [Steroidobacteraceae bacterium]
MIGLGRMGGNMAHRLLRGGHECVVHDFDLPAIAELWRHGSVIRSWLLDLTADALQCASLVVGDA